MTEERLQELENQQQSPEQQKQFEYITELEKSKQEAFKHLTESVPKGWNEEIKKYVNEELEIITAEYRRISSDQAERERFCERFKLSQKKFETIGIIELGNLLEKYKKIKIPRMRRPNQRIMANDTFTNLLFTPETMDTEEIQVQGQYSTMPKKFSEYTILSEDSTVLMDKRVYEYGRAVMDTIFTLYQDGIRIYTLPSLYKTIVQDTTGNKRVNNSQLITLFDCLRKLSTTWVQADGYAGTLIDAVIRDMSGEKKSILDEDIDLNQIVIGFSRPPLLSEHSGNQRITVPAELLRVHKLEDKKLSEKLEQITPDRIAIKNYLVRNVNGIITGNLNNNVMSLDTILYKSIGEIPVNRAELKRHRQYIETVLSNFTLKGFIKGFRTVKSGTGKHAKITGYEVKF